MTEEDARRALEIIQREQDNGTLSRVFVLKERDQAACRRYLLGDPAIAILLPEPERDWSRATLEDYLSEVYAPWRSESKPASWRTERGTWRRILRDLATLRLREVDAHVVADYLDGLTLERGARAGEPASGATKRLHRSALQALVKRAHRLRHPPDLPDLARFQIEGSTRRARPRKVPLDLVELGALMDTSGPKHRAMWAVGAGQGLRPSELVRIRWEDNHWSDRTMVIRGTKTEDSNATVPMTPLAHRELREWWVANGQPANGVTFPARKAGTPYSSISGFKSALRSAAQAAGIGRSVDPYLLRHSFATIAVGLELDRSVIRRIGRWTDFTMLDRVYSRPRARDLVPKTRGFDTPTVARRDRATS